MGRQPCEVQLMFAIANHEQGEHGPTELMAARCIAELGSELSFAVRVYPRLARAVGAMRMEPPQRPALVSIVPPGIGTYDGQPPDFSSSSC